tara:strand:+ start:3920 stop:4468 length:549 start_codon:yes stop_codon:yes gene_type:complete
MTNQIPKATEIELSDSDVSTNIGTITINILPQVDDNTFVQSATPTILADGQREILERNLLTHSTKITDKCIVLASINNIIICIFGFQYTFFAIFFVGLYFHIILIFGLQPVYQFEINELIKKKRQKLCDTVFIICSYIIKATWIGVKIIKGDADTVFIILGSLTVFHDFGMIFLMSLSFLFS